MLRVEVLPVTRMSSSELLDEGIRLEMALTPLGLCRSWKDPYARPARDLAGADGSKPQLLVAHPQSRLAYTPPASAGGASACRVRTFSLWN